jgi:hypothetical protein
MQTISRRLLIVPGFCLALTAAPDPARDALPPPTPRFTKPAARVLFSDDFASGSLERWEADREGVWQMRHGMLRADLPDQKQEHSLLYAGAREWRDIALDVDVCAMRGVDKGAVVRAANGSGIGVDLRGPGYQDVLLHHRQWPLGHARVINGNAIWHHLRIEASGSRYRVYVNGVLEIEHGDDRRDAPPGRIALAAYTGGVGQCTVYYDNVVVTALDDSLAGAAAAH